MDTTLTDMVFTDVIIDVIIDTPIMRSTIMITTASANAARVRNDDQAQQLLAQPDKFRIDDENRTVYLSAIFDWFGQDFIPTHGDDPAFSWGDEKERAVMTFSDREVDDALFERLRPHCDDDALVVLTGLIALQNASSEFIAALDLPAQGLCWFPPRPAAAWI